MGPRLLSECCASELVLSLWRSINGRHPAPMNYTRTGGRDDTAEGDASVIEVAAEPDECVWFLIGWRHQATRPDQSCGSVLAHPGSWQGLKLSTLAFYSS